MNNERLKKYPRLWVFFVLLVFLNKGLVAAEVRVAVASNFKPALQKLAADFKAKTGHELSIIAGSSGKLFAQIKHGAPYDVFLSADEKRPDLLVREKFASEESAYIYARGKLLLLSNIEAAGDCKGVLSSIRLKKLAIANPEIAPYGVAARQVLQKLGLWIRLRPRLVMGENIAQTWQFVSTKNAEAGFVAGSTMSAAGKTIDAACVWDVPVDMYSVINQKMVVLNWAKDKVPVNAFARYIRSSEVKKIISMMGYDVP